MVTPFALYIAMLVIWIPPAQQPVPFAAAGYGSCGYSWPYRECDAVNADGICIAWHSTLKGVDARRLANCNPWHCDLRPQAQSPVFIPLEDPPVVEQEREFEPHVIDLVPFNKANAIKGAR